MAAWVRVAKGIKKNNKKNKYGRLPAAPWRRGRVRMGGSMGARGGRYLVYLLCRYKSANTDAEELRLPKNKKTSPLAPAASAAAAAKSV